MKKAIFCYGFCVMIGIAGVSGATSTATPEQLQQKSVAEATETAKVHVSASIKTHSKRYHILEKPTRGTGGYKMEVEVAGKTYEMTASPEKDVVKKGDRKNPEEGSGVRFNFSGDFFVPAGKHKVTFRVPEENVSVSSDLTFAAGDNKITVKPVYGKMPRNRIIGFRGDRHFSQHVESLVVTVN